MKPRTRRQLHLLLLVAAVGVFAAAASYATIGETTRSAASNENAIWIRVVAVTTTALAKAAAEGVHDAALAAVEGSPRSAAQTHRYLAKRSAPTDRSQRANDCPLCRAGVKICPKRAGVGA